jgi:PRC-barrel domain
MADPVSWMVIEQGWSVVDSEGEDAGRIDEVLGDESADIFNGLEILTGVLAKRVYVPAERVGEIVEGRVQVLLTKDELTASTD